MSAAIRKSDHTEAIERELGFWPGASLRYERRGAHVACVFGYGGGERFVIIPATCSDHRGALAAVADMRRELRALGATREERERTSREHAHRKAAPAPPLTPPSISDPRPDGFAPLHDLRRRLIVESLTKWNGVTVNAGRLTDAAHALIQAWHPDIIRRAAELIIEMEETP